MILFLKKSMKYNVIMLRFSLKQTGQALLGNFNMKILISLVVFFII